MLGILPKTVIKGMTRPATLPPLRVQFILIHMFAAVAGMLGHDPIT